MPLPKETIEQMIKEALPDANIELEDLADDNDHYAVTITSSAFRGKGRIEQHRMIFDALKGRMGNELHALAIKTVAAGEDE